MKNVVITADFSASYANTILYALKLMQGKECNLWILNLTSGASLTHYNTSDQVKSECIENECRQRLLKLQKKIDEFFPSENYDLKLISPDELRLWGEDVYFLITGTNVLQGENSRFIREVSTTMGAPVLFIPYNQQFSIPRRVWLSLESSLEIMRASLKPFKEVYGNCNFSLEISAIYSEKANPAQEARDEFELKQLFSMYHPKIRRIHSRQMEGIVGKNLEQKNFDLQILLLSANTSSKILTYSQVIRGIANSPIPVMLLYGVGKQESSIFKRYHTTRTKTAIDL